MFDSEKGDIYYDLYRAAKFTTDELQQHDVCKKLNELELAKLSDLLFEIGIIAQKIMIENND